MTIEYTDQIDRITPAQLEGFFDGWPRHPSAQTHYEILCNSHKVWLALDGERCVGFVNALSDGLYCAYIPLLEVLPEYRRQGIGRQLVERMIASLESMYGVDLVCDEPLAGFYQKLGFMRCTAMVRRNYENQASS
jgi:ribosomal protein S18 acetylase RimI-like enzyme